jgi:hypothetical protein
MALVICGKRQDAGLKPGATKAKATAAHVIHSEKGG